MTDWKEKGGEAISEAIEVCRMNLSGLPPSRHFSALGSPPSGLWAVPPPSVGELSEAIHTTKKRRTISKKGECKNDLRRTRTGNLLIRSLHIISLQCVGEMWSVPTKRLAIFH